MFDRNENQSGYDRDQANVDTVGPRPGQHPKQHKGNKYHSKQSDNPNVCNELCDLQAECKICKDVGLVCLPTGEDIYWELDNRVLDNR